MGLFFKETIFLKEDSDLEKELSELENLKDKVTNTEELDKYIKLLKAGIKGEKAIEYELKNARIGLFVLHDINIQYEDNNAQIDYVIVTPSKCYLVECKNLIGDITVDNRGQFIRKLPWGQKEAIYSPVTQAKRHLEILKKIRHQNQGIIAKTVTALSKDDYYKPLVVVSNANGILNTKYATKEIKNMIVRVDGLIDYFKQENELTGIIEQNTKNEMERTARSILDLNVPKENNNWLTRFEITENSDKDCNDSSLKEKLLQYRKEESKKRNYPAYYIFNNDQLDKILSEKPADIQNLSKILEPIKIKMYGADILEIIKDK